MKRQIPGLAETARDSRPEIPDGIFLVRVDGAQFRWHASKPFYVLRLHTLEPSAYAGQPIVGRLYCTQKAMWKLGWFLRDFLYDPELLAHEQVDEKALPGLHGVVKISHTVINGISLINLDGFAPASQWEELSTNPVPSASRSPSNDFRFSSLQYCPARTSQRYLPSSTKRVSRSISFCFSHARISSILVRTNNARLRLSLGGIGGYSVNKFVKQTKVNSGFTHERSFDQVGFVEADPNEWAGCARILRKADPAVWQKQPRLDASHLYSTYLGGPGQDSAVGLALDSASSAYLTGQAETGFPTVAPIQPTSAGGNDGFVAKISLDVNPVVTPTLLSFGNQVINTTSAAKTVTMTNKGTATLNIDSVAISGSFAISSKTCGTTLAIGAKCTVKVTFTPTVLGALTGTLTFTDNAANSPQTVTLSGTGVFPVTLAPSTATYVAQAVGTTSLPKTFTLTNNQTVALTGITISTTGDFAVSATTCTASLAAKAKCTISVVFTPAALGKRTGTLLVSDSANNSPQSAALTGTGVLPATLTPVTATYSSQAVGTTSPAKTFTLTNNQTVALTSVAISTTGDFAVSATSCTTSLVAKTKCTISVTFKPTAIGTRTGKLMASDSASNSPQTSKITGTGK